MIKNIKRLDFPQLGDQRGHLVVAEGNSNIPFDINRIFYIYGSEQGVVRGQHANKYSQFVLINVAGSSKVKVRDGQGNEQIYVLDRPHMGLYLPSMVWKEMYDFSEDSTLLCLSDRHYDSSEYIRDYDDYVKIVKEKREFIKVSIVIPVYYNGDNLEPLYHDIKEKFINKINYDYEIIMVDDGSGDNSYEKMKELSMKDSNIKIYRLSKNFGSHAAILCGLEKCTGDCAVVKAADLQEPTEIIHEMVKSWKAGNNVVLAVREEREEKKSTQLFANLYYWLVQKAALSNMPKEGFDVYLLDRKVINVLEKLDERNSALTGQILWSGFQTAQIPYTRKAREIGKSKWTLRKKIRLVTDTLFSFSTLPITLVNVVGMISFIGSIIWAVLEVIFKIAGLIQVSGWTTLFIFSLFSFGVIMLTLGILGEYLWRTFDASRNRPPYIIEESAEDRDETA